MSFDWRRTAWTMLLIVTIAVSVACSDDKKNNPVEPEMPEIPVVIEVFEGQVEQLNINCDQEFSMTNGGSVRLQFLDLEPLFTLSMGMGVGSPDPEVNIGCDMFVMDDTVNVGDELFATAVAGTYCVCVYDSGNVFPGETVDYILEVTHPE